MTNVSLLQLQHGSSMRPVGGNINCHLTYPPQLLSHRCLSAYFNPCLYLNLVLIFSATTEHQPLSPRPKPRPLSPLKFVTAPHKRGSQLRRRPSLLRFDRLTCIYH